MPKSSSNASSTIDTLSPTLPALPVGIVAVTGASTAMGKSTFADVTASYFQAAKVGVHTMRIKTGRRRAEFSERNSFVDLDEAGKAANAVGAEASLLDRYWPKMKAGIDNGQVNVIDCGAGAQNFLIRVAGPTGLAELVAARGARLWVAVMATPDPEIGPSGGGPGRRRRPLDAGGRGPAGAQPYEPYASRPRHAAGARRRGDPRPAGGATDRNSVLRGTCAFSIRGQRTDVPRNPARNPGAAHALVRERRAVGTVGAGASRRLVAGDRRPAGGSVALCCPERLTGPTSWRTMRSPARWNGSHRSIGSAWWLRSPAPSPTAA